MLSDRAGARCGRGRRRRPRRCVARRRFRFEDFFSRMWFRKALRRMILPVPVTLKRLAAPRCVFIFGIAACLLFGGGQAASSRSIAGLSAGAVSSGAPIRSRCSALGLGLGLLPGRLGPLVGRQHHDHVAAVELRARPRPCPRWAHGLGDPVEDPLAELRVLHLPAPEHDRDLHLVTLAEELLDLAGLGVEVADADLRPVLHLLDGDGDALAPGLLGLLGRFVLELAVVHDPADRRVGHGGHLDEVEVELPGDGECLRQGLDAELRSVGADEADLPSSDPVVDPGLVVGRRRGYRGLLMSACVPPRGENDNGGRRGSRRPPSTESCEAAGGGGHRPGAPVVAGWGLSSLDPASRSQLWP